MAYNLSARGFGMCISTLILILLITELIIGIYSLNDILNRRYYPLIAILLVTNCQTSQWYLKQIMSI